MAGPASNYVEFMVGGTPCLLKVLSFHPEEEIYFEVCTPEGTPAPDLTKAMTEQEEARAVEAIARAHAKALSREG